MTEKDYKLENLKLDRSGNQKKYDFNSPETIAKIVNKIMEDGKDRTIEVNGFGEDVGYFISNSNPKKDHPVLVKDFSIMPAKNMMLYRLEMYITDKGKDIKKFSVLVDGNEYNNFTIDKINGGIEAMVKGDIPKGNHNILCLFYDKAQNETIGILNYRK